MTQGVEIINKERERQMLEEGWSFDHDDEQENGEFADAAACYALTSLWRDSNNEPDVWPWDTKWWKPTPNDRIRELAKAGALIAAEIDRLLRIENNKSNN